jgi:hypothetical protein
MAADIDDAFIMQYDSEVKLAYQRMGSKLSNTVRSKKGINGNKTTFFKAGRGTAGKKTRHGLVPLMNINHDPVEVELDEDYAADYVDKVDELKIQIDERKVVTDNAAMALGRRSDDIIIDVLAAAGGNNTAAGGTGLTEAKCLAEFEAYGDAEIPDDGNRYFLIPPQGWTDLLGIDGFSNADFVGSDDLPWKGGMVAKRWLSFMFITYTGLPNGDGGATEKKCLNYHGLAVGHASAQEITSEVWYDGTRISHLFTSWMSQGAGVIDVTGVREVDMVK